MDCEKVSTLLPWLLNGSLEGEERRRVAKHLSSCPACRKDLEATAVTWAATGAHPPASVITNYGLGLDLGGFPRATLETHLTDCPSCRQEAAIVLGQPTLGQENAPMPEVEEAAKVIPAEASTAAAPQTRAPQIRAPQIRASQIRASQAPAAQPLPSVLASSAKEGSPAGLRDSSTPGWRALALAASVAACLLAGALIWKTVETRVSPRPQANLAIAELFPVDGGTRGNVEIAVNLDGTGPAAIVLVPPEHLLGESYRVVLRGPGGRELWSLDGLELTESRDLALLLPMDTLPTGRLKIELQIKRSGAWEDLGEYQAAVAR